MKTGSSLTTAHVTMCCFAKRKRGRQAPCMWTCPTITNMAITTTVRLILLCCTWYTISSVNNVIGKKILTDFPHPVTITMIQMVSTALYLGPALRTLKVPRMVKIPKSAMTYLIVPLAFGKVFAALSSHVSIWKVPVSYAHTVKAMMPVFTVSLSRIIMGRKQTTMVYCSIIPIVAGVSVATLTELSFNAIGLMSALSATFTFSLQTIYTKKAMHDLQIHHLRLLLVLARIACLMFLPFWALYDLIGVMKYFESGKEDVLWFIVVLTINGFLNFAQNMVAFAVLSMVTPLSYAVATATKRILVITVSLIMLKNPVTLYNILGMMTAILGVFMYNRAKIAANRGKEELPTHTKQPKPATRTDLVNGYYDTKHYNLV